MRSIGPSCRLFKGLRHHTRGVTWLAGAGGGAGVGGWGDRGEAGREWVDGRGKEVSEAGVRQVCVCGGCHTC